MSPHSLVYPMFAMVLLTFAVVVRLFRTRTRFVRDGQVSAGYFKTYQNGQEPEASAKLARHFANLFETPVLFYVACLAAMASQQASLLVMILAWLYVATRCAHAFIHTGSNRLNHRIAAYFSSWMVLLALWITLAIGVAA